MTAKASEFVLVIDPGERVGWARAAIVDGEIVRVSQGVTPLKDFALKLGEVIGNYDTVVYETWRLRPDMARKLVGNDFQASQLVGIIRYLGWITPNTRLVSLGANVKNTGHTVRPEILLLRESTEEHDKDAIDLLSYYWWNKYV